MVLRNLKGRERGIKSNEQRTEGQLEEDEGGSKVWVLQEKILNKVTRHTETLGNLRNRMI